MSLVDVPFESAENVGEITYRLHPIDVGFDLRRGMQVQVAMAPVLRVSYAREDDERRVAEGPFDEVVALLHRNGYRIIETGRWKNE